jgi:PHP family Zn ribbon phosphoesterase
MYSKLEEMAKIVEPRIAETIVRVREENVKIQPGYDGVYGQLMIFDKDTQVEEATRATKPKKEQVKQRRLVDFT